MDSESDNEVSQIDIDSQISTSIRSSKFAKKRSCVYRKQYAKTFPWATTSRRGSSFAFCMKCSRDINLERGGTRDLRRHQEMKLHKHPEKDGVGVLPLQSDFGPIREESVICTEVLFTYFLGEHHLAFQLGDRCTTLFKLMFPDSSIAKDFKCSRTIATAVLKVIAQDCCKTISTAVKDTKYFSLQTDKTTVITVTQQAAIMLRFFDNTQGQVRCVFFALESVERETAELLFNAIDMHFQESTTLLYDKLLSDKTDGANVMLGARNSEMSRLRCKQPALVTLHCHCHIAALIANEACKVFPDELEDLTTDVWYYFQKIPRRLQQFEEFQSFVECKPHKLLKSMPSTMAQSEACVNRLRGI